jgi:enoyl-[acyl-carrier protein] reductase II
MLPSKEEFKLDTWAPATVGAQNVWRNLVVHTRFTEIVGITIPIMQAPMGGFTGAELAAAVSNAGGLGTLGAALRPIDDLKVQLARLRELTDRPFAVNHSVPFLDMDAFALTLKARPAVISTSVGDPGSLAERAHEAGSLVIHQVGSVDQALQAAERGVDVIIAQGTEAAAYTGSVAALPLIPQVVDAVDPIPVIAAGGIFDGRGLVAALALGAEGASLGTRFLASAEAPSEGWKKKIRAAKSEDAVKVEAWNAIIPLEGAYEVVARALRTPFIESWLTSPERTAQDASDLIEEIQSALQDGRFHELMPFAGQTAGGINEILPAGEIVRRIEAEAHQAWERTTEAIRAGRVAA